MPRTTPDVTAATEPETAAASDQQRQRDFVTATEAMDILKVRPQTLYAYVSRGWIRSIAQKGLKEKRYLRDDVARVGMRSLARSGHGPVAAAAMNWGEPIFPTSITEITTHGPRYRGHLATELVQSGVAFENVAQLLWTGELPREPSIWPATTPSSEPIPFAETLTALRRSDNLLEFFSVAVMLLGLCRGSTHGDLPVERALPAAREIMQTVIACCGFIGPKHRFRSMKKSESLVQGVMRALGTENTNENQQLLDAILILMADHEISPGALSARVSASAGGALHSCIAAALCSTSGVDVGLMYDRVYELLDAPGDVTTLMRRAQHCLTRGDGVPGFDHPLYPLGDPRAQMLFDLLHRRREQADELRTIFMFVEQMRVQTGMRPRQELALVVAARAMSVSKQAPAALFVVSRIAGWVAHVEEQRASGLLLRPRAKFVKAALTG